MTSPTFLPLRVPPLKERSTIINASRCNVDVIDGAFVLIDAQETRTHVPVGGFACIMLEPGTRITHAAVTLAARTGTLLLWIGEGGVRTYSAGQPGGARVDRLLKQAKLANDPDLKLAVVRRMFETRFGEPAPERRSIDQLRGIEGARVRATYAHLAQRNDVDWKGRQYDAGDWSAADVPNRCLSAATSCLHGIAEAACLTAGYSPHVGFLHGAISNAFAFDVADLFKTKTVVPIAFEIAGKHAKGRLDSDVEAMSGESAETSFERPTFWIA